MLLVFGGMLIISLVIPKGGLEITEDWALYFPSVEDVLESKQDKYVDIDKIISENQVPDTIQTVVDTRTKAYLKDSSLIYYQTLDIKPGQVSRKLEFPANDKSVLYPFFNELANLRASNKLIRILHYGDSQIESDRITSYIRHKLQAQFGGQGPGLIPAIQPYGFLSPVVSESSGEWKRYVGFTRRDTMVKHSRYGILASFSRFTPLPKTLDQADSVLLADTTTTNKKEYTASLTIKHSPYAVKSVKKYIQARLFYGYNKKPFSLKMFAGEELLSENILIPSEKMQQKKWQFTNTPAYLRLEFKGEDSPDIYAMALDGYKGVAVDNIALRGSSGLIFTNSSNVLLASIYRKLNVKLIMLQFGGNLTPYVLDDYGYYERGFYNQLATLKRLIPGVSIVVIGLADMSRKEKDTYVSYPNITLIRDALKKASFRADCAFWDMYEAMGGENSMPSWVFAEPALAEKDFIHFNPRGARVIAQMFYSALMLEYNNYIKKQNKLQKRDKEKVQYGYKEN